MAVQIGEVEVLARPPEESGASARTQPPAGPPSTAELEQILALQESRDLRLRAD